MTEIPEDIMKAVENMPLHGDGYPDSEDKMTIARALLAERKRSLQHGVALGFELSAEGYNAEYPFRRRKTPFQQDDDWCRTRDLVVSESIMKGVET